MAPAPIPEDLFTAAVSVVPGEVAARAGDPLAWRQTLAHLARQSPARIDHRGLQMHRLTQAILRDRLTPEQAAATCKRTEAILAASNPGDPANPATWPRWGRLIPHVLAADLAAADSPSLRQLACDACEYLLARGDAHTTRDLASGLHRLWRDRLGGDHEDTLAIAHYLAHAHHDAGQLDRAIPLFECTLADRERILGEDHPDTLRSRNSLARAYRDAGRQDEAIVLFERTVADRERILGGTHPDTLGTRSSLIATYRDAERSAEAEALRKRNEPRS